jgi:membrane protein
MKIRASKKILQLIVSSARKTFQLMRETDVQILASSLAFSTVFSLVPLLALSLSAFHYFGGLRTLLTELQPFLHLHLAAGAGLEVTHFVERSIQRVHSGSLGLFGVTLILFTSTRLFIEMDAAVHKIWRLKDRRPLWLRLLIYWSVIFVGPVLVALALGLLGSQDLALLTHLPKSLLSFLLFFTALFVMFSWFPNCKVYVRYALLSAFLCALLLVGVQGLYLKFTLGFLELSKLYGGLAAIPSFLLWIWLQWWICLGGVAFCAAMCGRILQRGD